MFNTILIGLRKHAATGKHASVLNYGNPDVVDSGGPRLVVSSMPHCCHQINKPHQMAVDEALSYKLDRRLDL